MCVNAAAAAEYEWSEEAVKLCSTCTTWENDKLSMEIPADFDVEISHLIYDDHNHPFSHEKSKLLWSDLVVHAAQSPQQVNSLFSATLWTWKSIHIESIKKLNRKKEDFPYNNDMRFPLRIFNFSSAASLACYFFNLFSLRLPPKQHSRGFRRARRMLRCWVLNKKSS